MNASRTSCDSAPRDGRLQARRRQILDRPLAYIPNDQFAEQAWDRDPLVDALLAAADPGESAGTAPLAKLGESALLTHEQERALFRRMNYVKYLAAQQRAELVQGATDDHLLTSIEQLIDEARRIRDHIVQANMRLVMSIVKKFVTPQISFDDLLSEGVMTLMQAVDKFDYDRGFRFSTYAYRSIARSAYHTVAAAKKEEARMTRDAEEWAFEQPNATQSATMIDHVWKNIRDVTNSMLDQLDRRERFIIRSRYALGAHRKTRTFQYLADKLGVSKERARQLERRAVMKMQAMSQEYDLDELFGAALA